MMDPRELDRLEAARAGAGTHAKHMGVMGALAGGLGSLAQAGMDPSQLKGEHLKKFLMRAALQTAGGGLGGAITGGLYGAEHGFAHPETYRRTR